ncbi:FG-GAP-like repeat-containing protein [Draconibacterium sp. IB214405]|uniref:FG-GAP-like repeat-containing protein n=1 Tax=Draconibacterium sp. IB214405 TaxID=3097352 RepID=UPI002A11CBDF|nr:FG-GAP-like repeat-containing protein [Draconibacterium sp. IB214405]MDX8339759.1 FG-GAP-like repeat-containing protein [Draconibacterium sp. IB214405]
MKQIHVLFIILMMGISTGYAQEFDITLTSSESGTQTHQARNSITFGPNYSYTPSGGTMTAEIVDPVVTGSVSYNYTVVDPETRSLNTSYMVGTTNGSFNVNPVGGATYSIPLDVPPGVAGLQPSISINYNSLAGSGIAGYGWQINGLSVITRSPKTYYYDSAFEGVDLTLTDRFSLDGQRMVCTSGTYGGNGSQYRTENDAISKVTCYTGSYGADKFEVKTKGGITCQYGYDSDADQTIDGYDETVSWYINKATDVYGNTMNYSYFKQNGHNYIGEITYGPNTITFFYKERSDISTSYLLGATLEQKLILDKVEIEYNSSVVKKYEFKYNYPSSSYNRHSVLNEIIEYGIGSSRYNSTAFSYQTPDDVSFSRTEYNTSDHDVSYKSTMLNGDFNGDGKADFLCLPNEHTSWTGYKMYYGDGNDNFNYEYGNSLFDFGTVGDLTVVDLNADGKDDILYETKGSTTSTYRFITTTGSAFTSSLAFGTMANGNETGFIGKLKRWISKQENDNQLSGADYNGDGINDAFINDPDGNWRIYSFANSSGQLTLTMSLKASGTNSSLSGEVISGDFNGDGKADIWSFDDNGVKIWEFNGSTLVQIYSSTIPTKNHFFTLGDFNADGKVDIFVYGYDNGSTEYDWSNWQVRLSTGTDFQINSIPQKRSNLKDDYLRIGDFNGDGASDLMVTSADDSWDGSYYYISKDEGSDFYSHSLSNYPLATHNYYLADYDGDGRTDFLCTDGEPAWWNGYQIYKSGSKNNILLEKVGNGLDQLTEISYQSIAEYGTTYVKGSGASFPVMDFQGPLQVVKSVLSDNGRGSQNTTTYKFEGAKIHRQGKGFLCHTKQTVTDVANNMSTETSYGYNTSKFFPTLTSTVNKAGSTTLNSVSNTWTYKTTTGSAILPYISSSTQTNSLTGHSATSSFTYDTYGNATEIEKSFNNGVTETTTNNYTNDATNWYIGKLNSSEVEYQKSGETTITNTVTYTYYTDGILKPDFIRYHEGTDKYSYKNHDYYSNGNLKQLYVYASGVGAQQTNYTYETNGVRVKTISDPMSHVTTMSYDSYGRLSSEEDYLDNTTSYTYDNMGRQLTETQADGFVSTTSYPWGLSGGPSYACYYVQQSGNDGSLSKIWHDKLGREIRSDVRGFSGSYIYTATEYNTKGQLYRVSEPSTSTSLSQWNTHSYDSYGRITGITRPSGKNTTYAYSSNRVTETTGGKSSWKETDSQGLLTTAHDNGGDITYAYYPNGKLKTINSPGGAVTSMEYDVAGNQTKLVDPSAGTIIYTYDAFGNLKTQKNARNQTTTYNYHTDGRVSSKVTPEGSTSYTYNSNEQLTGISSPGSVSRSYTYDSKGRVSTIGETIPGQSALSTSFTYDTKGRLSTRTHPSGIVETNNYNSYGYLASISAGGSTRYTINTMNARQQVTGATYGGSLVGEFGFDSYGYPTYSKAKVSSTYRQDYRYSFTASTGNLYSRQNYLRSKTETFTYDNLDRLTGVSGPQNLTMAYESNGNISTKSDLGPGTYTYGHATKPFAVTEINSGNQVIPSADQVATYNSFEQVSTIDEDDYHAAFTYNSDNQRCKMLITDLGSTVLTRWYIGSRYIKETEGSTTTEFTWIGGDAYSAPVVAEKVGSTTNYYYLLRDYLGNITHKVNTSNTVTAEYSFDAWGRRRDKDDWSYTLNSEPDLTADRGFTGHEHLSYFNIVNMNGRLYDPLVGRFLSPDENVQLPDFTQNFNRYSYCLNNPLRYNDLTGEYFGIDDAIAAIVGGVVNLTINAIQGNVKSWGAAGGYFATGAGATIATMYGGPLAGAAVLGAGNNLTTQISQNGWQNIDWWQVGGATAMSMATSYLGGQLGNQLSKPLSNLSSRVSNSPVLQGAITDGLTNSSTGFVLGVGTSKLSGQSWKESWRAGRENALWGLGVGVMNGGVRGYNYAKSNGLDPLTGEKILFRAVSENEYIDIQNHGVRNNPNGEGYQHEKLFYRSRTDAIENTAAYDAAYGQKSRIIQLRGPGNSSIYNNGYMDGFNVIRINRENLYLLRLKK